MKRHLILYLLALFLLASPAYSALHVPTANPTSTTNVTKLKLVKFIRILHSKEKNQYIQKDLSDPCTLPSNAKRCLNSGTCVAIDNFLFSCHCPSQFTGDFCQYPNACSSSPCANGGSCIEIEDSGLCACLPGFRGRYCEEEETSELKLAPRKEQNTLEKFQLNLREQNDPCFGSRCLNGGSCIVNGNSVDCVCSEQFTGTFCQFHNPCFHSPCKNSGTCEPLEDSGVCSCPPGFGGTYCQEIDSSSPSKKVPTGKLIILQNIVRSLETHAQDLSEASSCWGQNSSSFCLNGGRCIEGKSQCVCPPLYLGPRCQHRDPCAEVLCQNSGSCEAFDDIGVCVCSDGFSGTFCEIKDLEKASTVPPANPCLGIKCRNGGNCTALGDYSFECSCPEEYSGSHCQFPNPCFASPCLNGGRCEPFEDTGTCVCPPGFKGLFCEEIGVTPEPKQVLTQPPKVVIPQGRNFKLNYSDHCDNAETIPLEDDPSRPYCLNGGHCVILDENNYGCECSLEFKGPHCETLDECASSPCQNGGICESFGDSAVCDCSDTGGWSGTYCEEKDMDMEKKVDVVDDDDHQNNNFLDAELAEISDEEEDSNPNPSVLNHLYRAKIPSKGQAFPEFLRIEPQSFYSDENVANVEEKLEKIEKIDSSLLRIGSDGTIYLRKKVDKVKEETTTTEEINNEIGQNEETSPETYLKKREREHLVDASIVKVMPNGEIFVKMKIPTKTEKPKRKHRHHRRKHNKTAKTTTISTTGKPITILPSTKRHHRHHHHKKGRNATHSHKHRHRHHKKKKSITHTLNN